MNRIIKPGFEHKDERGIFQEVAKGSWKAMNYAERKKGSIIGNHYHKHIAETAFLVRGAAHVKIVNVKTGKEEEFGIQKGGCFRIEPFEAHALLITEDAVLVMLLSEEFDPDNKDLFAYEVIKKDD